MSEERLSGELLEALEESIKPPKRLDRRGGKPGSYQIWHSTTGDYAGPYITDVPSIQVAMRRAKEMSAMKGTDKVVIYDDLGNFFKAIK